MKNVFDEADALEKTAGKDIATGYQILINDLDTYRISIDGDCHNFNYRTDYFSDAGLAKAWKDEGHQGEWEVPNTWQKVQEVTKFLGGKKFQGMDAFGYLDPAKGWGGFGFYFLGSRATAYAKHPDDKAWLFDADTMKPRVNNPAWVRAVEDYVEIVDFSPPGALNFGIVEARKPFVQGHTAMILDWGDTAQISANPEKSKAPL